MLRHMLAAEYKQVHKPAPSLLPAQIGLSTAIRTGHVRAKVSPLDLVLRVLPLAQLRLHLFLDNHAYGVP